VLPEGATPNRNERLFESLPFLWEPFHSRADFDFAWQHYVDLQTSGPQITKALNIRLADLEGTEKTPQWATAESMYTTIDAITHLDLKWKTFKFKYKGPLPDKPPRWMKRTYELNTLNLRDVMHSQFASPDLADKIRLTPVKEFETTGERVLSDFMTADWVWSKAVSLSLDSHSVVTKRRTERDCYQPSGIGWINSHSNHRRTG
jgi:hypothetical protein